MTENYHVVAVNGSPHEGFGNTSQMLTMLGENLSREGLELEEIFLSQYQIGFCTGCATCLESRLLLGPGRLQLGGPYRPGG